MKFIFKIMLTSHVNCKFSFFFRVFSHNVCPHYIVRSKLQRVKISLASSTSISKCFKKKLKYFWVDNLMFSNCFKHPNAIFVETELGVQFQQQKASFQWKHWSIQTYDRPQSLKDCSNWLSQQKLSAIPLIIYGVIDGVVFFVLICF